MNDAFLVWILIGLAVIDLAGSMILQAKEKRGNKGE